MSQIDEQTKAETTLREETEKRLRMERKRIESEFALSVAKQEKARRELHWNPRPVEESIAEAARWFQQQLREGKPLRPRQSIKREASG